MLTMYKQITIKTLFENGMKKAAIASELECHRNTVRNIVKRDGFKDKQSRQKQSLYTPYKNQIETWYKKDKLTRFRIHEKLQEEYQITGSYDALRRFIQKHFPKKIEAFGVQIHEPGEEAEIDFGELGRFPGSDGKLIRTFGLGVILPYSKLDFFAICYDQKLETLCRELENAFVYLGGVPKRIKVDNMKTAVLKNQHYDLTLNPDFLEFAYHYGTVINPCVPYSPEQKGTVENGIKYLQNNFAPGRTFYDDVDIKRQLRDWMDNHANKRIHGTTRRIPMEMFLQEEKGKLRPLPTEAFSFFNRCERTVGMNCHIHFENNYYSVPFSYVQKTVTVRWNKSMVRIIYQGEEIALHKKSDGQGNFVTRRLHLPSDKIYSETEYQQRHENKMKEIGVNAHRYFAMLKDEQPGHWQQTLRPIYGFVTAYGNEAVDKALGRALSYNARDIRIIKNILEGKLYEIVETIDLPVFTDTVNSRELSYYQEGYKERRETGV